MSRRSASFPPGSLRRAIAEAVARARRDPGRVQYVIESFRVFPALVPRLNPAPVTVSLGFRVATRAPDMERIAPMLEGQICESVAGRVCFAAGGGPAVCLHTEGGE